MEIVSLFRCVIVSIPFSLSTRPLPVTSPNSVGVLLKWSFLLGLPFSGLFQTSGSRETCLPIFSLFSQHTKPEPGRPFSALILALFL